MSSLVMYGENGSVRTEKKKQKKMLLYVKYCEKYDLPRVVKSLSTFSEVLLKLNLY